MTHYMLVWACEESSFLVSTMAAAVRRSHGFIRYALSVQYHGSSFLGFQYQGPNFENSILPDGTDLRGYRTVEGRLREALGSLVGEDNFENVTVSSRTDRGVHALKNTCHVDIRQRNKTAALWDPTRLVAGLNYHLTRQHLTKGRGGSENTLPLKRSRGQAQTHTVLGHDARRHSPPHEVRVLEAAKAPLTMKSPLYTNDDENGPAIIDWNVRFSATQRTYAYRILHQTSEIGYNIPFEWDRSWRLYDSDPLDIAAMKEAASHLIGTHDFTSFRGSRCQRLSPIVTMKQIDIQSHPYRALEIGDIPDKLLRLHRSPESLVTVVVIGKSFLYRQVRNMVGCLVAVGRGKLEPSNVRHILEQRDRRLSPEMAPAHGLFLVDVQHGDFDF